MPIINRQEISGQGRESIRDLSVLDLIAGEMMLVPGVEMKDHGHDEIELHVGGRSFAHMHGPDRIELRLPPDLKEFMISQGTASRSPAVHDREGWVILKLGPRPDLRHIMRVFHQSYQFASATI